jgi:hypothetical protein
MALAGSLVVLLAATLPLLFFSPAGNHIDCYLMF